MNFKRNTDQELTQTELSLFEANIGLTFPDAYKQHMLKFNGGFLVDQVYFDTEDGEVPFSYFFPLNGSDDSLTVESIYPRDQERLPANYITIGTVQGGFICMDLSGSGNIYVYYEDLELVKAAESFAQLISDLKT